MEFHKRHHMAASQMAVLAFYGMSWGAWGTRPSSNGLLPDSLNAFVFLVLMAIGLLLLGWIIFEQSKGRIEDRRVLPVAVLGLMLGLVMIAIVGHESQNFYSVSAGVFASLIIAVSVGGVRENQPETKQTSTTTEK